MVTFRANVYEPLDMGMAKLQLCCWSFHTKKLCSRLYSVKIEFYLKTEKSLFDLATLWGYLRLT